MVEGKKRYKKVSSTLVEMEARRTDDYQTFASNAARTLDIDVSSYKRVSLFKCSTGARISKDNDWTLGSYLRLLKKNANSVTIGVGCIDNLEDEVSIFLHYLVTENYRCPFSHLAPNRFLMVG